MSNPKRIRTAFEQNNGIFRLAPAWVPRSFCIPGAEVTIHDSAAYGLIMMQGHGSLNGMKLETPALIRFGQLTNDEYFVSEKAAKAGVRIVNESSSDPIVMLKHFGPENPDWVKQFV